MVGSNGQLQNRATRPVNEEAGLASLPSCQPTSVGSINAAHLTLGSNAVLIETCPPMQMPTVPINPVHCSCFIRKSITAVRSASYEASSLVILWRLPRSVPSSS